MLELDVLSTSAPQLKLGYNASNTVSFSVSSGGDLTIAPGGGDTAVTGTLAISSTLAVTGATTLAALAATTGTFSSSVTATTTVSASSGNVVLGATGLDPVAVRTYIRLEGASDAAFLQMVYNGPDEDHTRRGAGIDFFDGNSTNTRDGLRGTIRFTPSGATATKRGSYLAFYTAQNNVDDVIEALWIDNTQRVGIAGNVAIGTTTFQSTFGRTVTIESGSSAGVAFRKTGSDARIWYTGITGGGLWAVFDDTAGLYRATIDSAGLFSILQALEVGTTIKASGLPTSAGAAGTLWVDGSGFVKRA